AVLAERGVPWTWNRVGSMFCLFFREGPVRNLTEAKGSDLARFAAFFHALLEEGVYFPPSQFEACFLSLAHDEGAVDRTVEAVRRALA
ncbi:MAG: aspartate aminotransferase family protein, partial [Verrucomicrobiia bacterium]